VFGMIALCVLWAILSLLGFSPSFWAMTEAIATAVTAATVLGGAILALEAAALHLPWLRARIDDYGEFMRQRVLAALAYESGAFVRAQQARAGLRRAAGAIFGQVDVLLGPIHAGPVPDLGVPAANALAIPFNCLGWPALTQPAGLGADGLPLAVQLVAAPWQEATLLRAAYAVEQALGPVIPPL
ncbi:MAG: hypothetical protein HGA45_03975, partial [Chloroflexales bacterium]|nr:hypothetical protein [Chloroflexales bacterium]